MKYNYFTKPDRRPPKSRDKGEIDEILSKCEEIPYCSIANICGAKILLVTDSKHVMKFWELNWYKTVPESHDGVIYVVNNVKGYSPHLYYDLERKIIVIVNSEYYGAVKSAGALGLAGVILEDKAYPIHGACVGYTRWNKPLEGVIIIAPTGTGKTTQSHELLYNIPTTYVHSDDYVFVHFEDNVPIACATEMQLYMRTNIAKNHPIFIEKFNNLPLENVRNNCYWSYDNSRVIFPREEFPTVIKNRCDGQLREVNKRGLVVESCPINYILLLTRDENTKPVKKLDCNQAIEVLREGKYIISAGAGPKEKWGQIGYEPFYNPYPPEIDHVKQEAFFRRLFNYEITFYLLNTGSYKGVNIAPHQTHMYIRHILEI